MRIKFIAGNWCYGIGEIILNSIPVVMKYSQNSINRYIKNKFITQRIHIESQIFGYKKIKKKWG